MPNGWRPTTTEGLLSHLSRETRIQGRNRTVRLEPLVQDVVDASQAVDNLPPGDVLDTMTPEEIEALDGDLAPELVQTSSDPNNTVPNPGFETVGADGLPTDWGVLWDFFTEPDNPLRWDGTPTEARTGVGRGVVTFTTGWVNNTSVYSKVPLAVVPGARYLASVYVKSTVTGTHSVEFNVISGPNPESAELFATGSVTTVVGSISTPGAEYTNIAAEVVIPPNHGYAKLQMRAVGTVSTQTGEVSWDDASLVQLGAGTVPGGTPWYAGPRLRPFMPKESVYNATQTSMMPHRLRVVGAKAGRDTNILCYGDSVTAGWGGAGVKSWPGMLLKELEREGCIIKSEGPSFLGMAHSITTTGTPDPRWTFSGTVAQGPWSVWGTVANGSWAEFASTRPGTIIRIKYLQSGGNFAWSRDGGAAGGTVTTSGLNTTGTLTVSGLANTTHTMRVTGSSATPAEIVSIEVESDVTGLRCYGAGVVGAGTAQLVDTSFKSAYDTALSIGAPDLVLLCIGINDANGSLDPATYMEWMRSIVVHAKQQQAGVGIVVPPHVKLYSMTHWVQYAAALYDVADYEDVPLVDLTDIWGAYDSYWPSSLAYDFVHPNVNGHANYAHAAKRLVL